MKKNVNTTAIIASQVCWAALDVFITTFLVAEILYFTGGDVVKAALFYVVTYTTLFLFFWGTMYFAKRLSSVWCMRVGVAVQVATVSLICAFAHGDKLMDLYLLFGAMYGAAMGIYWSSTHCFTAHALGSEKMLKFQTALNIATCTGSVVFPFTLGTIIHYVDFWVAALVAAVIGGVLIVFTAIMKANTLEKRARLSMINFVRVVKQKKLGPPVAVNFALQVARGLYLAVPIMTVILITRTFGDSFSLGYLGSIFAACAIVILFGYRFIRSRGIQDWVHMACVIVITGLAVPLLFNVSKLTVILFQVGAVVLLKIPGVENAKLQIDGVKELGARELSAESLVVADFGIMLGRVFIMAMIILIERVGTDMAFRVLVLVQMSMTIVTYALTRIWWKMVRKTPVADATPLLQKGA